MRRLRRLFRKKEKPVIKTETMVLERDEEKNTVRLRVFEFTGPSSGSFYDTCTIILSDSKFAYYNN